MYVIDAFTKQAPEFELESVSQDVRGPWAFETFQKVQGHNVQKVTPGASWQAGVVQSI